MLTTIRESAVTVAALGALGLGGAAIAGAAGNSSSSGASSSGAASSPSRPARMDRPALSSAVGAKVKAAALAKVPGATVLRTEAGGPYGTPYHPHVRTSDGTLKVVLVDSSFAATAVQDDRGRGFGGGRDDQDRHGGPGGPGGGDETALTGPTKQKVEAAVLGRYSGATIVRTETNADSSAPYESHVTTSTGRQLEVLVSKSFEVVDAREQPRPSLSRLGVAARGPSARSRRRAATALGFPRRCPVRGLGCSRSSTPSPAPLPILTTREREVAALLAAGKTKCGEPLPRW